MHWNSLLIKKLTSSLLSKITLRTICVPMNDITKEKLYMHVQYTTTFQFRFNNNIAI